jgi:hypothetical protein
MSDNSQLWFVVRTGLQLDEVELSVEIKRRGTAQHRPQRWQAGQFWQHDPEIYAPPSVGGLLAQSKKLLDGELQARDHH